MLCTEGDLYFKNVECFSKHDKVDNKVDDKVDGKVDGKVNCKVNAVDGKVDGKVDDKILNTTKLPCWINLSQGVVKGPIFSKC